MVTAGRGEAEAVPTNDWPDPDGQRGERAAGRTGEWWGEGELGVHEAK
jgi:hypothetical protein